MARCSVIDEVALMLSSDEIHRMPSLPIQLKDLAIVILDHIKITLRAARRTDRRAERRGLSIGIDVPGQAVSIGELLCF
jgi:hypothetical protein